MAGCKDVQSQTDAACELLQEVITLDIKLPTELKKTKYTLIMTIALYFSITADIVFNIFSRVFLRIIYYYFIIKALEISFEFNFISPTIYTSIFKKFYMEYLRNFKKTCSVLFSSPELTAQLIFSNYLSVHLSVCKLFTILSSSPEPLEHF